VTSIEDGHQLLHGPWDDTVTPDSQPAAGVEGDAEDGAEDDAETADVVRLVPVAGGWHPARGGVPSRLRLTGRWLGSDGEWYSLEPPPLPWRAPVRREEAETRRARLGQRLATSWTVLTRRPAEISYLPTAAHE
jgi:hypothetical protein